MTWRAAGRIGALLLGMALCNAHAQTRAVWAWERDSYQMLEIPAAADDTLAFLRFKKIDGIYLYADAFGGRNLLVERPALYGALIRRLRGEGIHTYALLGSWYLHTEQYIWPARQAEAVAMLRRVLDYNAKAPPEERFEGVNLDIEPHLLDEWGEARKAELLGDFLDLGKRLMDLKRERKATLAIGPAIPFWLDGITLDWRGTAKPVSEHVLDTYDYIALMDYRDHAEGRNGVIALARSEMRYAEARGKRVAIGLDLSPGEPESVSFNHLAETDLERTLEATAQAYASSPAFGGFVFHHLRAYRDWLKK